MLIPFPIPVNVLHPCGNIFIVGKIHDVTEMERNENFPSGCGVSVRFAMTEKLQSEFGCGTIGATMFLGYVDPVNLIYLN